MPKITKVQSIKKILIANRGEIAARIIRTCHRMGIKTVAIYSEVDQDLDFVAMADESVCIGPASAQESYLCIPKIVAVCHQYQVDAVHPGYGFLSENAEFAETLEKEGIVFIGPRPSAIRTMGSKGAAKKLAKDLHIPIIEGYAGEEQSLSHLMTQAQQIDFPLLIKATHGGGGKGMRRVDQAADFSAALESCQREAQGAFGNGTVMLEKYIVNPRHIEVQIFGDQYGEVVALAERDCSLQRRHQKIIEEAPAYGLSSKLRQRLHEQAIILSKAVDYVGAGTVEFLVDPQEGFYFLEMNTRLQVEHPVTEMILGIDLVEWQIRVAQGESLTEILPHLQVPSPMGHALEARLYAEDPSQKFLPSTGVLTAFHLPLQEKVRLDKGYGPGNKVTIYYDPLLAKLIVHGIDRQDAYEKLAASLKQFDIQGVKTNRDFLIQLCHQKEVVDHLPVISFLDQSMDDLLTVPPPSQDLLILLGLGLLQNRQKKGEGKQLIPWDKKDGWRLGGFSHQWVDFTVSHGHHRLSCQGSQWSLDGHVFSLEKMWYTHMEIGCMLQEELTLRRISGLCISSPWSRFRLFYGGHVYEAHERVDDEEQEDVSQDEASLMAPMPGRVLSVFAKKGESIEEGAPLMILEAMKMEHTIRAPYAGVVDQVSFVQGDFVEEGMVLVHVVKVA